MSIYVLLSVPLVRGKKTQQSGFSGADLKLNTAKTGFVFFLNQG